MSSLSNKSASQTVLFPRVQLTLLAAFRFRDAFTEELVPNTLQVKVEALQLEARFHWSQAVYCLTTSQLNLPQGEFKVDVNDLSGQYRSWEPLILKLPYDAPGAPTELREQYLFHASLFPTRRLPMQPGGTAVAGRIKRLTPGADHADLRVQLIRPSGVTSPQTRTDDRGEFLVRIRNGDVNGPATEVAALVVLDRNGAPLTMPGGHAVTITMGNSTFATLEI